MKLLNIINEYFKLCSYIFFKTLVFLIGKVLFRMSIKGMENIPKTGGVIIASNHASYFDPPLLTTAINRHVSFVAKKELFRIPLVNYFLYITNSIPIDRHGFNAGAQKTMLSRLKNGEAVVVFPEGTRSKDGKLREPKAGAGMAAVIANVPVVPCCLDGSFNAIPFISKITFTFLPPFHPDEIAHSSNKEHYFLVSERIIHDISKIYKDQNAGSSGKSQLKGGVS